LGTDSQSYLSLAVLLFRSRDIGQDTKESYDFLDKNFMVHFVPIYETNNIADVAKHENFISINNALMADLTGQICLQSLRFSQFS